MEEIHLYGTEILDNEGNNIGVSTNNAVEINISYADVVNNPVANNVRIYGDAKDTVDFGDNGTRSGNIEGSKYQDNTALINSSKTFWNKIDTVSDGNDTFNVYQFQDDTSKQHLVWVQDSITII